jgi:uncharacterized protein YlxW (UPF0749 family)
VKTRYILGRDIVKVQAHPVSVPARAEPPIKTQQRVFATTTADSQRVEAIAEDELSAKALRRELTLLQREVAKLQNEVNALKSSAASSITAPSQKPE